MDSAASTSGRGPSSMQQLQQGQLAGQRLPMDWDYKYQRFSCASPVEPWDTRLLKVEALFQHVLGYPRLPPRVHRHLKQSAASVDSITAVVEGLAARYGKELVLYLVRRCPHILERSFEEVAERADVLRSMLDLKPHEIFMIMRKNPLLLVMDSPEARARFNKLHRMTPLSHEAVKVMVRKYPLVLNCRSETIAAIVERLRHLAYTRAMWQQDFDCMSPSLMAFFLRDYRDLLMRLEYLVLTGDSTTWTLRQVFKPSNNCFIKKHRGFREWVHMRMARRQQLQARARQQMANLQEQQGERS